MDELPIIPDDYTAADLAGWLNAWTFFGWIAIGVIVLLLAVIAFRGR